jgi:hypothetical protein
LSHEPSNRDPARVAIASEQNEVDERGTSQKATRQQRASFDVPPPPKGEFALVLLPNIVLPVVLLLLPAPNMLAPVFAGEPKPEAEGKLDTVRREARGAGEGRVGAVARRSPRNPNKEVALTRCVVVGRSKSTEASRLGVVVVRAEAPETTAEGHFELVRRVARVLFPVWLTMRTRFAWARVVDG